MRTLLIILAVSLAARGAHAQAPGVTMSFDPGPPQPMATPMSAEDADVLETGEIGPARWIVGAGVSAWIGLGFGQTVQGRWRETGWIFTVGESVSLTTLFISVLPSFGDCFENCHQTTNRTRDYLAVGSLIAYLGFRAWDLGDAIGGPIGHNQRYRAALARHPEATQMAVIPFIVPSDRGNGGVAGLALSF